MKYIGKLLGTILLVANVVTSLLMLFSGYSSYIHPESHPILACAGLTFGVFLLITLLFFLFWLVVYPRYTFCSVLTIVLCWNPIQTFCPIHFGTGQAGEKSIKVLSYNTLAMGNLSSDKYEVANYLKESDADIICLQEFSFLRGLTKKKVDDLLSKYRYKHYNAELNLGCYSRFPILSSEKVKYKTQFNGSMAYRMKIHGDTVLVINNHLESNKLTGDDKTMYKNMVVHPNKQIVKEGSKLLLTKIAEAGAMRAGQGEAIHELVKKYKGHGVIVCGDFNDSPMSYVHRILREDLTDAFSTAGNGLGFSYHLNGIYFRIDHMFVSPQYKVTQCKVDNTIDASDHYPIFSQITLP